MVPPGTDVVGISKPSGRRGTKSRDLVRGSASEELFFAVVGHVGSGTSAVAKQLESVLLSSASGPPYEVKIIKARQFLLDWDASNQRKMDSSGLPGTLEYVTRLQDVGDDMREEDHSAIAGAFIREIRRLRASMTGQENRLDEHAVVPPDGRKRAYILDSIRHPAEAELLSRVYQNAFVLIGVVCDEDVRLNRLRDEKFKSSGLEQVREFMQRDAKDKPKNGQRVSDAFHKAHFFVDNTEARELEGKANKDWDVADQLSRLKRILTQREVVRPTVEETAMFSAQGACVRSSCLSRQVGAAVVDSYGNVISLGTNEVPRAGGGVYGMSADHTLKDERCFLGNRYCSNNKEQARIMEDIANSIIEAAKKHESLNPDKQKTIPEKDELVAVLRASRISSLLEFSRAVHAEMEALLSLARRGVSAVGTRVFVTTFPCHYCARHLVGAGVHEVHYIEPYPKSKALDLHKDAIETRPSRWKPLSEGGDKVLFRPFVGVAPRLYREVFTKNQDLKNDTTGELEVQSPEWTEALHLAKSSYLELEAAVAKEHA